MIVVLSPYKLVLPRFNGFLSPLVLNDMTANLRDRQERKLLRFSAIPTAQENKFPKLIHRRKRSDLRCSFVSPGFPPLHERN